MNNLRNSVRLIGHLGNDPDIREFESGKKIARISLATSESYTSKEGKKIQETQWHNLVAWDRTAGIAEKYLKKGHEIAVEGRLTSRSYEDKEGIKRYMTEIVVNELLMLEKKNGDK